MEEDEVTGEAKTLQAWVGGFFEEEHLEHLFWEAYCAQEQLQ